MKDRKAKVTEVHKAEARKLKAIWDSTPKRLSQAEFGEKYNIGSQSAVTQFLNGSSPLSMKAAVGFAQGLGCSIENFSLRLAQEATNHAKAIIIDESDFLPVKLLMVDVSAGPGRSAPNIIEENGELQFRHSFLKNVGVNPKNAAIVYVRGSSMEPTIYNGSVLLLNRSDIIPRNGIIYAFALDDMLHIKRFFSSGKTWIARSDNPDREEYPDIIIDGSRPCNILGRAIWMGVKI